MTRKPDPELLTEAKLIAIEAGDLDLADWPMRSKVLRDMATEVRTLRSANAALHEALNALAGGAE